MLKYVNNTIQCLNLYTLQYNTMLKYSDLIKINFNLKHDFYF